MATELQDALDQLSLSQINTYTASNAGQFSTSQRNNLATAFIPGINSAVSTANQYDTLSNYVIQSQNLNKTVGGIRDQTTTNANIADRNEATATRNREIKEWYYNNKLDTLFVFQLIFISITLLGVLAFAMKGGYIGVGVFGAMIGILVVLNVLIITNRALYTEKVRDKKFWSKRNFTVLGSPLPGGSLETKCQ